MAVSIRSVALYTRDNNTPRYFGTLATMSTLAPYWGDNILTNTMDKD